MSDETPLFNRASAIVERLGIVANDVVLIHSDTANLVALATAPERRGPQARERLLADFHRALRGAVGDGGTLAAPAAFYEYARFGTPFVVEQSPPDRSLGAYPRWLFEQADAVRSLNPIHGIVALGKAASTLCGRQCAYGMGAGSPWAALVAHDAKMLFWGVDLAAMTFVHHAEHLVGVPHIYNKRYEAPVLCQGQPVTLPVISPVRYLQYEVRYNLSRFIQEFAAAGLVKTDDEPSGGARVVNCRAVLDFLVSKLSAEPYYLLDAPPKFEPGKVPIDGHAGPLDPKLARRE